MTYSECAWEQRTVGCTEVCGLGCTIGHTGGTAHPLSQRAIRDVPGCAVSRGCSGLRPCSAGGLSCCPADHTACCPEGGEAHTTVPPPGPFLSPVTRGGRCGQAGAPQSAKVRKVLGLCPQPLPRVHHLGGCRRLLPEHQVCFTCFGSNRLWGAMNILNTSQRWGCQPLAERCHKTFKVTAALISALIRAGAWPEGEDVQSPRSEWGQEWGAGTGASVHLTSACGPLSCIPAAQPPPPPCSPPGFLGQHNSASRVLDVPASSLCVS